MPCDRRGRRSSPAFGPDDREGRRSRRTTGAAEPVEPFLHRRSVAEQALDRGVDVLGGVVVIENLMSTAELPRRSVPNPFGAVTRNGDPDEVLDAQSGYPVAPSVV